MEALRFGENIYMNKTFVIAEAGVNHNGSEELALQLVDIAVDCGADAVKFQTFKADKLVRHGAAKAAYQEAATGAGDQHSMLTRLEMSEALHRRLFERCTARGIEFMSTPFDEEAVDFLVDLGMKRIKIPSGEITNNPFLRYLAGKNKPLILSTGMATLDEILDATAIIKTERDRLGLVAPLESMLIILHCTSNYPAAADDVNLRAMRTIASATGMPVGYSDHTLGLAVSTAAVALGAVVIEKHFTLDNTLVGPDHKASLIPDELKALVAQIRTVECALGSFEKRPADAELPVRALVRRSVTSVRDLPAGIALSADDLCLLRPGTGIPPRELDAVTGRLPIRDIPAGATLQWSDFS
jgi:N,N'-diacetyllegionaminate synthase